MISFKSLLILINFGCLATLAVTLTCRDSISYVRTYSVGRWTHCGAPFSSSYPNVTSSQPKAFPTLHYITVCSSTSPSSTPFLLSSLYFPPPLLLLTLLSSSSLPSPSPPSLSILLSPLTCLSSYPPPSPSPSLPILFYPFPPSLPSPLNTLTAVPESGSSSGTQKSHRRERN